MKKVELLAPAGSKESLIAAIQSGADAVYLGGKFSARKYAKNFDNNDLIWAVNYAHLRNVRIFVTVNILFKNNEFDELINYLDFLYLSNVDAFIIQDLSLIPVIKSRYPDIEIHVSTQASVTNQYAVRYLESLGVHRIVLARENTIDEIRNITSHTSLDIEVFVHGAMCVSYSGQCLMSSFIGKRSGNRGECAQPCRLPYQLYENNKKINDGYLLSQKDLMTIDFVDQLIESGIYSFKIEGRMKSPEYVQSTIQSYRKAIDAYYNHKKFYTSDSKQLMTRVFNRAYTTGHIFNDSSILDGLYSGNRGVYIGYVVGYNKKSKKVQIKLSDSIHQGDVILFKNKNISRTLHKLYLDNKLVNTASFNQIIELDSNEYIDHDDVYLINDTLLKNTLNHELSLLNIQSDIDMTLLAHVNKPLELHIKYNSHNISIQSDYSVEYANNKETTTQRIIDQLSKTNDTPFNVRNIKVIKDDSIFIPIKILNELRREAISQLESNILKNDRKIVNKKVSLIKSDINLRKKFFINVSTIKQFKTVLSFKYDYIIIPYNHHLNDYMTLIEDYSHIILNIDRCLTDQELEDIYNNSLLNNFDNICVNDLGALYLFKNKNIFIGQGLNVFNNQDLSFYMSYPCIISPEVNYYDLMNLNHSQIIYQVYGNIESMITKYCPISNTYFDSQVKHCNKCKGNQYFLIDRIGNKNQIITDDFCKTHIYNSKTLLIEDAYIKDLNILISFTYEDVIETNSILEYLLLEKNTILDKSKFTRGYSKH